MRNTLDGLGKGRRLTDVAESRPPSSVETIVRDAIALILADNRLLLRIPLRQKAKFEGWLKFELAHALEQTGMRYVEVETKGWHKQSRTDITFFYGDEPYSLELKTPNTNWRVEGVSTSGRPITNNISSIVDDARKLNSTNGIVAFVLFPIPCDDTRWHAYLHRIGDATGLDLSVDRCSLVRLDAGDNSPCDAVVCAFRSRRFRNW